MDSKLLRLRAFVCHVLFVIKADLLTIVGHKFYGPRIGALYHRGSDKWKVSPLLLGGGQEYGLRLDVFLFLWFFI